MDKITKYKQNKCRTCFFNSKGLLALSKNATDESKQQKTYAAMLNEVANIDIMNDKCDALPQVICGCCLRKLKAAHTFVQQAQGVNEKFWSMLQEQNIDKLDCLQESQIDIQTCLEIKVERDEVDTSERGELLQKNVQLKIEETEEVELAKSLDLVKTNVTESEEHIESHSQNDASDLKFLNADIKMSDIEDNDNDVNISLQNMDMSESDNDSFPSDTSDWHEELETSNEKQKKKKKILPKRKKPKGHNDPLKDDCIDQTNIIATEDEMLPVCCEDCDKVFANSRLLNRHRRGTHVPDDLKIQCLYCDAKFSRRHNMYAHVRAIHKTENLEEHKLKPNKLEKEHTCHECPRSYTNKYRLLAHVKKQHNPENIPATSSEKLLKPKKRFLCTLCGLTFDSQSNLNIHYRRHTGEKPYKCDYCDRAFHRLYDSQVHLRSHTGEKPYQCTICEKAFRRSNKLKIHMRTHTNERPYKCTQCEKAFKQSKDLNIHKRTHTGERPYKCGVCQSTFTQSNSLRLHQTKQKHFDTIIPVEESNLMYQQQSLSIAEENNII